MADTVRELLVKIGFGVDDKGLKQADDGIASLTTKIKQLAEFLSVPFLGHFFFNLANDTVSAIQELEHLGTALGDTTQNMQAMKDAALMADINFQSFATGIAMFNRNVGEALSGHSKQMLDYMHAAGIKELKNQNGELKSQAELLGEVSDKLKSTASAQERANIVMSLFGRGGLSMMNMLVLGSDKIKDLMNVTKTYGYVFTEANQKAADSFDANYKNIKIFARGIKESIGVQLIPVIDKYLKYFSEIIKAQKSVLFSNVVSLFKSLRIALIPINIALGGFYSLMNNIANHVGGWENVLKGLSIIFSILLGGWVGRGIIRISALILTTLVPALKVLGLTTHPISTAITTLGMILYLVYDDFKHFRSGSESLIGHIVAKYPLAAKIVNGLVIVLDKLAATLHIVSVGFNSIFENFEKLGNASSYKKVWQKFIGGGANTINVAAQNMSLPPPTTTTAASSTINNNTTVNLTVPAGTPTHQQNWLADVAKKHFEDAMQRQYKSMIVGNPVVAR